MHNTRTQVLNHCFARALACAACWFILALPANGEDILTDDFSEEVAGRWESIRGAPWSIKDGEFWTAPKEGDHQKSMVVANFPMKEGVVEAIMRPQAARSASVGLVGKFLSPERCVYMRIAYWQINVLHSLPQGISIFLGPFSLWDREKRGQRPEEVRLKMVFRGGIVGLYINGVLRTVFKDPYPDEAGRPGLYSESTSYADSFRAEKTK